MKSGFVTGLCLLLIHVQAILRAQPQPGTVLWTYNGSGPIQSSPALAADGTVYLDAGGISAVTNNGVVASNKWILAISGQPVLGADGTIYCASGEALKSVSPTGSIKWSFSGLEDAGPSGIGSDGTIYIIRIVSGQLYALSPSGAKKWDYLLSSAPSDWSEPQFPVLGPDGTIYAGLGLAFYACTSTGTNKWSVTLPDYGFGNTSPAIAGDGTIYASGGGLRAFSGDGGTLWSISGGPWSPVVGSDGTIYVSAGARRALYAVTSTGQVKWTTLEGPMYGRPTAPAIDAGGMIYYCVSNSVWALNPKGQVQWKLDASADSPDPRGDIAMTSPIIGPDGTIYAALGAKLYAIISGTNGAANSPWPMYRGNAQHTGRIQKPSLQKPKKRADANFDFETFSQSGISVTIESSTNLASWSPHTNFVSTTNRVPVVDLTASNSPAKFYRAKGGG